MACNYLRREYNNRHFKRICNGHRFWRRVVCFPKWPFWLTVKWNHTGMCVWNRLSGILTFSICVDMTMSLHFSSFMLHKIKYSWKWFDSHLKLQSLSIGLEIEKKISQLFGEGFLALLCENDVEITLIAKFQCLSAGEIRMLELFSYLSLYMPEIAAHTHRHTEPWICIYSCTYIWLWVHLYFTWIDLQHLN